MASLNWMATATAPATATLQPDMIPRDPVDKLAAIVTRSKGEKLLTGEMPGTVYCEPIPPPQMLSKFERRNHLQVNRLDDLSGTAWSGLTCVGMVLRADGKVRWVVKCVCGNYVTLKSQAVRAQSITHCPQCLKGKPVHQTAVNPLSEYEASTLIAELIRRGIIPRRIRTAEALSDAVRLDAHRNDARTRGSGTIKPRTPQASPAPPDQH